MVRDSVENLVMVRDSVENLVKMRDSVENLVDGARLSREVGNELVAQSNSCHLLDFISRFDSTLKVQN